MRLRNMALSDFIDYVKDKEILCFGGGKLLRRLCSRADVKLNIKAVFDNDKEKHGKMLICEKQSFKIYSWKELNDFPLIAGKTVIVISAGITGVGRHLYEELVKRNLPSEVECFFLSFVFAEIGSIETVEQSIEFRLSPIPLIPRYIHYCWFGGNEIPEEQQKFIQGWKEKCPSFEVIRWDESNYDVKKNKYMKRAYEEKRWGFVPDYARKDIIYRYGGIYLDTDVEIIRNMDALLYQKGFAGKQLDDCVAFGLGFGAAPGLDIMAEMCEEYEKEEFSFSDGMSMRIGPDYETEILKKYGYDAGKGLQMVAGLTIYPAEVLSGTMAYSKKPFITGNTFSVHHFAGSWTTGKRKAMHEKVVEFYKTVIESEFNSK